MKIVMIKYQPKRFEVLVAMARKGLNQKELSVRSDLNPSTLSTFLNGKRDISPTSARKIADVLDADIKDLFEIHINQKAVNIE